MGVYMGIAALTLDHSMPLTVTDLGQFTSRITGDKPVCERFGRRRKRNSHLFAAHR